MLKVYQCGQCGKTFLSKEEIVCEGWKELVAGSVDASKEKHVPVVTVDGNVVKVDVGSVAHPMTAEHLIEWVAVETSKGYQIQYLKAEDVPVCTFVVADGDSAVGVYAYCNLHGLWKA